jgi:hypothetical protein
MKRRKPHFLHLPMVLCIGLNSFVYGHNLNESTDQFTKEIVVIKGTGVNRKNKNALLILPGFSDRNSTREKLSRYFSAQNYDLFIPDYCDRSSLILSEQNLNSFISREKLYEYKELNIITYNLGASILSAVINDSGTNNIKSVLIFYNPVQVYIHKLHNSKHPRINRLFHGAVVEEYIDSNYQSFSKNSIKVGFIIAQESTWFQRQLKERSFTFDTHFWASMDLQQKFNDLVYIDLNSREILSSMEVYMETAMHFLDEGRFKISDRRVPYKPGPVNPGN